MSTQSQDRKVQEARRNLGLLRDEAHRACNDYKAHLGELVSAVDAKDEPSISTSYDGAFQAGARLRDIIEEDVAALLDVLAPDAEPDTDKFRELVTRVEAKVREEERAASKPGYLRFCFLSKIHPL